MFDVIIQLLDSWFYWTIMLGFVLPMVCTGIMLIIAVLFGLIKGIWQESGQ